MPLLGCNGIDILEITEIPQTYIRQRSIDSKDDGQNRQSQPTQPLAHFLGAMLHSDIEIGFRIQSMLGQCSLYHLTRQSRIALLSSAFSAQFSGFGFRSDVKPLSYQAGLPVHLIELSGVPKPVDCALDGLVEMFAKSCVPILYQVWTRPRRMGYISKKIAEHKYKSALERSQRQQSISTWLQGNETHTKYNILYPSACL